MNLAMRAVRLGFLSQQSLARLGLQQARLSFVSPATCDAAAAAAHSASRYRYGDIRVRALSQLSAPDHQLLSTTADQSSASDVTAAAETNSLSQQEAVERFLQQHDIHVSDKTAPGPILRFEESGLQKHLLSLVLSQFSTPTPIQAQAIPIALAGRNMVGIGQTGSGKTLAFILPALAHIMRERTAARTAAASSGPQNSEYDEEGGGMMQAGRRGKSGARAEYRGPRVVILAPTRELAKQIEEVAAMYRRVCNVKTVCCIGGENRSRQLDYYSQEPDLMIATPGRLNDFLLTGEVSVSAVSYVVLDEADRMLDMGFEPQIRSILDAIKPDRQILMFSATWPEEVQDLAEEFLRNYTFMNIGPTKLAANKNITQRVVVCSEAAKQAEFLDQMEAIKGAKILVFTERKVAVDRLERILRNRGIPAMGIHGDKTQMQRSRVIKNFKEGACRVMIATDVAARGLDINNVEYVVNYDFPMDIENYVHRIGRTARSNKTGTSITLITDNEARYARKLVQILHESEQAVPEDLLQLVQQAREERGGPARGPAARGPVANRRMYEERKAFGLKKFVYKGLGDERFGSRQQAPSSRGGSARKPRWDHEGFVYDTKY